MFREDFSCPKYISNPENWVFPISKDFYNANGINKYNSRYESRLLKVNKIPLTQLCAEFSETKETIIATIKLYDRDFNYLSSLVLENTTGDYTTKITTSNVSNECCWYKVIVSSNISYLKLLGI